MNASPKPSDSQADMVMRIIENRMLEVLAQIHTRCNSTGTLPLEEVQAIIKAIDDGLEEQQRYESAAGVERLTPLYFELAAGINAFRDHLLGAMHKAVEAANQSETGDHQTGNAS